MTLTDELGMVMIETEDDRRPAYPGDRGVICLCEVTGAEVRWETIGREDACRCSNCTRYLKPPEAPGGDPAPVTVAAGNDPWPVLRAMQKFMPGTPRGECYIVDPRADAKRYSEHIIGYTILLGHPERIAQPVFDCRTRIVEVVELADWLKARGYEASACQWNQPNPGQFSVASCGPAAARWQLITGKAQLPPLPSTAPSPNDVKWMGIDYARNRQDGMVTVGDPPDLFANAKAMLKGR